MMYHLIRVHKIYSLENEEIDYHFQSVSESEFIEASEEGRLEIGEELVYSMPDTALLSLYVNTAFGFAGGKFSSPEAIAAEMAKHVLLCSRGCRHQQHTALAL